MSELTERSDEKPPPMDERIRIFFEGPIAARDLADSFCIERDGVTIFDPFDD